MKLSTLVGVCALMLTVPARAGQAFYNVRSYATDTGYDVEFTYTDTGALKVAIKCPNEILNHPFVPPAASYLPDSAAQAVCNAIVTAGCSPPVWTNPADTWNCP